MELNSEQQALQRDRGALVSELMAHGAKFKGSSNYCTCAFHKDSNPSAGIKQCSDGAWRLFCFVCNDHWDIFDVRAKIRGCSLGEVLKEVREYVPADKPKPTLYASLERIIEHYSNVEAVYKYTHPETKAVELAVIRYRKETRKAFAQCSPREGGWVAGRPEGKLPLYNRTRVVASDVVVVVEGEKAVHALTEIGFAATTSPMGAGKAHEADWSPLKGKRVYLWPDNDPLDEKTQLSTGIEHMKAVQRILEPLDCKLFWISPEDLELAPKGDAVDFIAQMSDGKAEDKRLAVQMVLDDARPMGASKELKDRVTLITSGQWRNIEWPWPILTEYMQALVPTTVTALCGEPGSGKSFFLIEAFMHWHIAGEKVALFELEDDRTYHLQRALAQLEGNSNLTQVTWMAANAEETHKSLANQSDILDSFGRVLYDAPDKQVTLTDLADWFEARSAEGVQISGIDVVTAAIANDKPWIEDQKFMFRVKGIAKRYKTRLVFTIHPRVSTGKGGAALSKLAGGAAYSRFADAVAWISRIDPPVNSMVFSSEGGRRPVTHDRVLNLTKARNGKGAGSHIAYHLNAGTLRFEEYGSILPEEVTARRKAKEKDWNDE